MVVSIMIRKKPMQRAQSAAQGLTLIMRGMLKEPRTEVQGQSFLAATTSGSEKQCF